MKLIGKLIGYAMLPLAAVACLLLIVLCTDKEDADVIATCKLGNGEQR